MRNLKEPEKIHAQSVIKNEHDLKLRIKALEYALDYYCDPDLWYEFLVYGTQSDFSDDMGDIARRTLYGPNHTEEEYIKLKRIRKNLRAMKESKK